MTKYYKHKKRGSVYRIISSGHFQCADKAFDNVSVVMYTLLDGSGSVWVRPESEFFDGRFEVVY